MVDSLELGEVPFYWRIKKSVKQLPNEVPERLPFAFSFMHDLQLVIQKRNQLVLRWLEHIYKEDANVGYLQDGHALAESYGGEFIEFFCRASALLPSSPNCAADIGCGGVYLLQKVRELGLAVKGIDPSPVTLAAGRKAGIEIVPDFYPSLSLQERFDVLFHYDVLEHVEDPVAFLKAHHKNLTPHGAVIFAVPDCSQHISLGDVSMLLHEHLNYFDEDSLARVVMAAGFKPILLEPAIHGGVLYCCAVPAKNRSLQSKLIIDYSKFENFCVRAKTSFQRFTEIANQTGKSELGLYVPLRAFPYLAQLKSKFRLRFFDDDPGLHGRYYDGFDNPVENRDDLVARPPGQIIVCSLAFGNKIVEQLSEVEKLHVIMWSHLFDEVLG